MCSRLAVEFSQLSGNAEAPVFSYPRLGRTLFAQGDVHGAVEAMEKSDRAALHPNVPLSVRARHAAYRVIFAIRQDDITAAVKWGDRLTEYIGVIPFEKQHVPARLLIARGEKDAAAEQLQHLYERAYRAGAKGLVIGIRVCQAMAAPTAAEALAFLAEALTIGQPEGFIRTFVDEGNLLAPLLRRALSQEVTPEYTSRLLNIIEDEERQHNAVNTKAAPSGPASGLLSEREIEILRLVADGQSNREIAATLVIALGTAKTHVHRIFEKLDARDRLQAVTRARELKLV